MSSTSPVIDDGSAGMPLSVSRGSSMQPALAVDQRPHARRADLPVGQPQLGEQRRHLGAPGDERFGADVDRLAAELFGAQHATQPVGGLEHRDIRVVSEGDPQPVRGDKT